MAWRRKALLLLAGVLAIALLVAAILFENQARLRTRPPLTPELARAALVDWLRQVSSHEHFKIFNPDVVRVAPIRAETESYYHVDGFGIDVKKRTYGTIIGTDPPIEYQGDFIFKAGAWQAWPPRLVPAKSRK